MTFSKKYALGLGCFFIALVAVMLHVWQLFFMAAILGLLAPASWLLSRRKVKGLRAQRRVPAHTYAGRTATGALEITNTTSYARRSLFEVSDTLPQGISAGEGHAQLVVDLAPGETTRLEYEFTPTLRGVYRFGPVRFSVGDALGIYSFTSVDRCYSEVIALPAPVAAPNLWPRAPADGGELRRRRATGPGMEMHSVREYVPGDDLRRISWTNSARRGELVIVESEQRQAASCAVILDLSSSSHTGAGQRSSLEYAVVAAATLVRQAVEQGAAVGLIAVGDSDYSVPVSAHSGQEARILEALARCRDGSLAPLGAVVGGRREELARSGAVAVISPQVGAEAMDLAQRLVAQGRTVVWLCIRGADFAERQPGAARDDAPYQRFAAAIQQIGCRHHLISGVVPVSASFGGWFRAAS